MTSQEAWDLVCKYNAEPFHRTHAKTVGCVMRYFGEQIDPKQAEQWEVIGLLHDIDFEQYPEEHCVKGEEILTEEGVGEDIIVSAMSHGWGLTDTPYEPTLDREKVLFAVDELTGLIGACAMVRPSKSVADMELKSLKKKYKQPSFAAGCSRETIAAGADLLDWTLDDLLSRTLEAMKACEAEIAEIAE